MKDLGYQKVVIGYDLHDLMNAVKKPWIGGLCSQFGAVVFEIESSSSNRIAQKLQRVFLKMVR